MRLATIHDKQSKDGRLVVVSSDGKRAAPAPQYRTLSDALRVWDTAEKELRALSQEVDKGVARDPLNVDDVRFYAPLPAAPSLLDGSAFIQHVILARKARGAAPPEDLTTVPLMYQGRSDKLLGPRDQIRIIDPAYGYDFEGEFAIVTGEVAAGTSAENAKTAVKLLLLMNDISLRMLIPREAGTGFGFVQGKPGCAFAPFAVTPDELGDAFRDGRVELPLSVRRGGSKFGEANGREMHFSFYDLISHAARTRDLSAGTIIGGGTVSNTDETAGSSCITEKRMLETIRSGKPETPFLAPGETVEMEVSAGARSIFGLLRQECVAAAR